MKACDATTPHYTAYKQIISQLRCPVCGGQRIDSSNAAFATSIKRDVCGYVHKGMKETEIITQLEKDYAQSLKIQTFSDSATLPITALLLVILLIIGYKIRFRSAS